MDSLLAYSLTLYSALPAFIYKLVQGNYFYQLLQLLDIKSRFKRIDYLLMAMIARSILMSSSTTTTTTTGITVALFNRCLYSVIVVVRKEREY